MQRDTWIISTATNGSGNCVEVMQQSTGGLLVRNSNDRGGPTVKFTDAEWKAFLAGAKDGEFDL